ncbi:MAG: hypothetical protein FWE31_04545 [Firmicutes bacterium]|nr:hypothetical protein [Bacillota bacterium]
MFRFLFAVCLGLVTVAMPFVVSGCSVRARDFSLAISASATTINQGGTFEMEMVFRNRSGRRLEVNHLDPLISLFLINRTFIYYDGQMIEIYSMSTSLAGTHSVFERGEERREAIMVGHLLPIGVHEFRADTFLTLGSWVDEIRVLSNIIRITVI